MPEPRSILGTSPLRKEGRAKVTGRAQYVDDITLPFMWYGATVRSTIPRGRILSITFDPAIPWSQFTIVTAADIPGENCIVHLAKDHPCLATTRVNHYAEPILLLAHPDKAVLPAAVAAVHITYEQEPGVFTIEDSELGAAGDESRIIWRSDDPDTLPNTFKTFTMQGGDEPLSDDELESIFTSADFIVEGEYRTGAQEQLYIEPNGVIAEAFRAPNGSLESVTVSGSMQCPFYVVHALEIVFNLPPEKCRVIQTETGGAFGGKEDFPSVIGSHAALLAAKSGHPVKICYDRAEDLIGTTKRHPSRTRHRTAVSRDGKLLAGQIDLTLDGGAYATLSPTVLSRAIIHAAGPYRWPHLTIRGKALATNIPPHGAFRGFGAPQSLFAMERHIDKIAHTIGLAPEELRRRNFLSTGTRTATGQLLTDPVDMDALLTRALRESRYYEKRAEFDRTNAGSPAGSPAGVVNPTSPIKRGIGIAAFMHGAGFTGSGERRLNSLVTIEVTQDGRPRILVSSTEFGQGTNTILSQVCAETLRLPYDEILVAQPDTAVVPNSGPTVASRTAMIVGKLIERASQQLLASLTPYLNKQCHPERSAQRGVEGPASLPRTSPTHELPTYTPEQFKAAAREYVTKHGTLSASARYELPPNISIRWDDDNFKGDAYPTYAWAVYVAEVAVDTRTYSASCTDFHALQEVGRILHPVLAAGQIEGGVAQAIGHALYEKCEYQQGILRNNQMTNYIMPTAADLPAIHVHFEEVPSIHGPGGAKGIGELPMDGPAPAILNAIEHATGIAFTQIPLLPEDIFERMTQAGPNSRVPHSSRSDEWGENGGGSEESGGANDLDPSTDLDTRVEPIEVPA